jgi:hypothetical protein
MRYFALAILLLNTFVASVASAQNGTWTTKAPMPTARYEMAWALSMASFTL